MPSRGYRKGISDKYVPLPKVVLARLTEDEHNRLAALARAHLVTRSKLIREILRAKLAGRPVSLPHQNGPTSEMLRQIARTGNNLNQLAKLAHQGLVPLHASELRACLATLNELARRL